MNYEEALKLATEKHKGQKRKMSDVPAITHPIAVADKFKDEKLKIVSVLHDAIEDTNLTLGDLRKLGLEEDLIFYVNLLTRKPGQPYLTYILQLKKYEVTRLIKIEDIKHNLSDNPPTDCHRDKYLMALHILNQPDYLKQRRLKTW